MTGSTSVGALGLAVVVALHPVAGPAGAAEEQDCAAILERDWFSGSDEPFEVEAARHEKCLAVHSSGNIGAALAIRLSELAMFRGDYEAAWQLAGRAIAATDPLSAPTLRAQALDARGNAEFMQGRFADALGSFAAGLEAAEQGEDRRWQVVLSKDLGITHLANGHPEEALDRLEQAARMRSWWPDNSFAVSIWGNLGSTWVRLDAPELALASFDRALAAARTRGDPQEFRDVALRSANLLLDVGDAATALAVVEDLERVIRDQPLRPGDLEWLHWTRAWALELVGRHDEAIVTYRARLASAVTTAEPSRVVNALIDLGTTLLQHRGAQEAARSEAAAIFDRVEGMVGPRDRALLAGLDRGRSLLARSRGRFDHAIELARASLATSEAYLERLPSARDRSRQARLRAIPDLLVGLLLERGTPEDQAEAFAILERGRSIELAAALASSGHPAVDDEPRILELLERLARLEGRLAESGADVDEQIAAAEHELDARRAAGRLARLRDGGPALEILAPLDLEGLRAALTAGPDRAASDRPGAASERVGMLTFSEVDHGLVAAYVEPAAFRITRLEISASVLVDQVDALRELLGTADATPIAAHLSTILLEPFADLLTPPPSRLIVVPDGPLGDLPFDILPWNGLPLVAQTAISLAPSATVAMALRARTPNVATVASGLVVGHPGGAGESAELARRVPANWQRLRAEGLDLSAIPSVTVEAQRVRRYLADSSELWIGEMASEARLKRAPLGVFDVIHLAAHGIASRRTPSHSALWLTAGDGEDGLLQAREIAELPIRARLVVLSACRSSQRAGVRGEGVHGLARAFIAAGAGAVVATVLDVRDTSSAHLMDSFYRRLAEGNPPAEALRSAKAEAATAGLDPREWAPFVLVGEGDAAVVLEPQRSVAVIAAGLAGLGFLACALVAGLGLRQRQ